MTSLIDSSWERVDEFLPPGIAAEDDSWELVEDSTELVLLDLPHTKQTESSAWSQVPAAPGTSVVLTGLDTPTPLLKVGETVMQGTYDELLGSEIVLKLERDNDAKSLRPLAPPGGGNASGASSTSMRRITFTPVRRVSSADTSTHARKDLELDEDMPLAWQT